MRIGVVRTDQETRVATCAIKPTQTDQGRLEVAESGAGLASGHDDQAYIDAGASIGSRDEVRHARTSSPLVSRVAGLAAGTNVVCVATHSVILTASRPA